MKPPLKDRLLWDPSVGARTRGAQLDRATTAKAGAYLLGAGGATGLLLLALPHPQRPSELGILVVSLLALAGAAGLILGYEHIPDWAFQAFTAIGTAVISAGLYFEGAPGGWVSVLYIAVAIVVFYFYSWRAGALQLSWLGICFWFVLLQREPFEEALQAWVGTMAMLAAVGYVVGRIRRRVEWLAQQQHNAAFTDGLTSLLNRRGFEDELSLEFARARRWEHLFSVVICDLDHFKELNDKLGHPSGDAALMRVARILQNEKRRIDSCARLGGEEFGLILPDTDEHGAFILCERIRELVGADFASGPVNTTASFGVATFPTHAQTSDELVAAADKALYAAKAGGRDRCMIYGTLEDPANLGPRNGHGGPPPLSQPSTSVKSGSE